jgi:hypothetical protein
MTSNGAGAALEIQEGYAGQVLAGLTEDEAKVLVFISHGAESETGRKRFKVLREVAQMIDLLVADRSQKKWHALVEALTPDVELSRNKVVEAEMLADARSIVLESKDYVKATAIAGSASYSSKNPSSQPNRWKRNGQIFAIHYKGVDLYPAYALDHSEGVRPLPIMSEILKHLADKDDWQKAFWFEGLNSYLKNRKPKQLLRTHPAEVLRAAELEAVGVQHG